mmetsp:Transcript_360/g.1165  ORF Transcript_360/g.1165 Transcript_360/m.1165 type:complete len:261 (-) Transcript_360:233-1015(-)|eukprot:scaffold187716_cov32-Tisochrysis_lutea.AAC.1
MRSAAPQVQVAGTSEFLSIVDRQTTGGHVWEAARALLHYIEQTKALHGCTSLLELGAGTGWLGMSLALQLRQQLERVALTEMEEGNACEWLRHNVELNRQRLAAVPTDGAHGEASNDGLEVMGNVEVAPLDWCCVEADERPALMDCRWDAIIGSDLIYNEAGATMLPRVMRVLIDAACRTTGARDLPPSPPCVLYAHTRYRFEHLDRDFFEECAKTGLVLSRVWPAEDERPPSPPPFTELFPDQYVAIYKVTLRCTLDDM